MFDIPFRVGAVESRVRIGTMLLSVLGTIFGSAVVVAGSFLEWTTDGILGVYGGSGWSTTNLVAGDGRIAFVMGVLSVALFAGGAVFLRGFFYLANTVNGALAVALGIFEIACVAGRTGIVTPGTGLYMVLGGGVVLAMCGLGGYLMLKEDREGRAGGAAHVPLVDTQAR